MNGRVFIAKQILALLLTAVVALAHGQTWNSELATGQPIRVDPDTNKATITEKGVATPLWDGVHRLRDGSSITVRSGIVVPNRPILGAGRDVDSPFVKPGASPCRVLGRKVCGLHDECATAQGCGVARQLVELEGEVSSSDATASPHLTQQQCREGLQDEAFFPACEKPQRGKVASPCERLLDKACGSSNQCATATGCGPAKQLVEMEYGERRSKLNPDALTATSSQCREALRDEEIFPRCRP